MTALIIATVVVLAVAGVLVQGVGAIRAQRDIEAADQWPRVPTDHVVHTFTTASELCDNCGSPLVVVRSREGRFCTSECAEAFELS